VNILIVSNIPIARSGMRTVLGKEEKFNIIGEADNAAETLLMLNRFDVDLIIISTKLKGNDDGVELLKAIKKRFPGKLILVTSILDASVCAEEVLEAGGDGFFNRDEPADNLVKALKNILSGGIYLSRESLVKIGKKHISRFKTGPGVTNVLSCRELEIFRLIGKGMKRKEIAEQLDLNVNTVESHRRKIREKLNLTDSGELRKFAVMYYAEKGLK